MRISFLVLSVALALQGCDLNFFDAYDGERPSEYYGSTSSNVVASDGYVSGALGLEHEVNAEAIVETQGIYDDSVQVRLDAEGYQDRASWAVMHQVTLNATIEPGTHIDTAEDSSNDVSVVGCSGPSRGQWEYDRHADRVIVDTEEGATPGQCIVHYRAEFYQGTDVKVAEGQFVMATQE